ncbi:MAG TPA: SdrD B-like domain-containing protein [Kiritimatiellia bacterium]|nr:SdrD B-like domain-containing protein [Kiritimatiellia bacterium]HMP00256.1 SdrD B-like domain-containing protein [Kiritimatiellia bacterium]HMP97847.1 SdrD B-like domain-containing protein [Kiritimatiellia bacterium]
MKPIPLVVAVLAAGFFSCHSSFAFEGLTIGGRVWDDVNRNGLQDAGEPGLANVKVYLSDDIREEPDYYAPFATNITDASGRYAFTGITNNVLRMVIYLDPKYMVTLHNVGDDETIDNDFQQARTFCGYPFCWFSFDDPVPSYTNIDAGVYALVPDMNVSLRVNGRPDESLLYVTNGAMVTFDYAITNTGETSLSFIYLGSNLSEEGDWIALCPDSLNVYEVMHFTKTSQITESMTNNQLAEALGVDFMTCEFHGSAPLIWSHQTVIIVVTNDPLDVVDGDIFPNEWEIRYGLDPLNSNAPSTNTDGDWMTDWEEYLADTDPTDAASFFPAAWWEHHQLAVPSTSTGRIYSAWRMADSLTGVPEWIREEPEQTGTGSRIVFDLNPQESLKIYRTGVRLP